MLMQLYTGVLIALCLAMFAAHFWRKGRVSVADPAFFVFILFAYSVLFKAGYVWFVRPPDIIRDLGFKLDRMFMGKSKDILFYGMLLITLSMGAYLLGLQTKRAVTINSAYLREREIAPQSIVAISLVVMALSIIGLLQFLDMTGGIGADRMFAKKFNDLPGGATQRFYYPEYWLFKATTLVKCAFYAMLIMWFAQGEKASRTFYIVLFATLALSVLVATFAGNRATSILYIVEFLILWSLRPSKASARMYVACSAILVAVIVATSLVRYEAVVGEIDPVDGSQSQSQSQSQSPLPDAEPWEQPTVLPVGVYQKLEVFAQGRYGFDLIKTSHIVDATPRIFPYLNGQTFYGWLFVFVPKSWWPDKPIFSDISSILSDQIFEQPENNIPPSVVAES